MAMRFTKTADFVGKTIKSINTRAANVWKITFTDGSKIEVWAETDGPLRIPTLFVDNAVEGASK